MRRCLACGGVATARGAGSLSNHSRFPVWLGLLAAFALSCTLPSCGVNEWVPHRVIWIAIDSLSAERLHFMGYPRETSPWLDEFARESVVFEWAFSPSNVTPRSVASYLTGRYYSQLHRNLYDHRLPGEFTTLAEWFQANGFHTTGFNTNPFVVARKGYGQGFDTFHDLLPSGAPKATLEELVAEVRLLYTAGADREFIYVHTMDVHHPYRPPAPHGSAFAPPEYTGTAVVEGDLYTPEGKLVFANLPYFAESQDVDDEDIEYLLSQYEGAVHYTDRELSALLDALRYDPKNDLLLISADHGEQIFEHGYWLHGITMMPQEIHVPLLVRWDGFPASMVQTPVSLVDFFPTFAELFSLEPPQGLVGQSLLPALRGAPLAERPVYSEAHVPTSTGAAVVADGHLYWLCTDNSQLTPWVEWPYFEVLCDLRADPRCERDLAIREAALANRLNGLLRGLNPVWRNFAPERIRRGGEALRYGPQLIEGVAPGPLHLDAGAESEPLQLQVRVEEPRRFHLLALEYRLASGTLDVSLVDRRHGRPIWQHQVRHAEPGWQMLRVKLRPSAPEVALRIVVTGEAEVRTPELRRLHVPELPIIPWRAAVELRDEPVPPSDEEAARLRALGYLE